MTDLTLTAINGHSAAQLGYLASDCPHLATSSAWAAWLYGFGLGSNNASMISVKKITQSRGYNLRVQLTNRVDIVPFPVL